MRKKFMRDYRDLEIWYDEDTNFWESSNGLRSKQQESLKILIDEKMGQIPSGCIVIDGRGNISMHKVMGIDESGEFLVNGPNGAAIIAPKHKHFKDTLENRKILEKIMKAHNKAKNLVDQLEKL